jgi:hypothetical protein
MNLKNSFSHRFTQIKSDKTSSYMILLYPQKGDKEELVNHLFIRDNQCKSVAGLWNLE